jgi:Tfp pilus assembly protein PilO
MLAKRIIIATITLLLLIAFVRWGTDYIQTWVLDSAKPEKVTLAKEIDTVQKSIADIPKPDAQLPVKLAQLEKELEQEGKAIPQSMDGTLVINSILELAQSCNVTATPLQTHDWSVKDEHYLVYTLQIHVEGNYEQIATFIGRLETELFENLIIVSSEISGGLKTDTEPDIADLQVAIYTGN